jgi:hypothetical protein
MWKRRHLRDVKALRLRFAERLLDLFRVHRRGDVAAEPYGGQPTKALFTAVTRQLIATCPVCPQSNEGHSLSGALPSAMLTPRTSSLIATLPPPSQSPTHPPAG